MKPDQRPRDIGLISFVVPAWNEEANLGTTLTAIREAAQGLPHRCEIVVANDGSTDRTQQIAERLADRTIQVHYRQIAATRNAGARAAQGDLLISRNGILGGVPWIPDPARQGTLVWRPRWPKP